MVGLLNLPIYNRNADHWSSEYINGYTIFIKTASFLSLVVITLECSFCGQQLRYIAMQSILYGKWINIMAHILDLNLIALM